MATNILADKYKNEVVDKLQQEFEYQNPMQIPEVSKVVVNAGVGMHKDSEFMKAARESLSLITGQSPLTTYARKSVSQFKVRKGMPVGLRVTLRQNYMYNFLYRLVNIALPRVRDFRGVSPRSFDGNGNYNLGLSDQSVFTEIDLDQIKYTVGMDISVITTAKRYNEAYRLLELMGMPFSE